MPGRWKHAWTGIVRPGRETFFFPLEAPMPYKIDEALHRIRLLELQTEEYKLKARRMALHAAHLEVALKKAKQKPICSNEQDTPGA